MLEFNQRTPNKIAGRALHSAAARQRDNRLGGRPQFVVVKVGNQQIHRHPAFATTRSTCEKNASFGVARSSLTLKGSAPSSVG